MSRSDFTAVEERLRRALHEVASVVPDEAPARSPSTPLLRPVPAFEAGSARAGSRSAGRHVAALVAAAAVTLGVIAGSVALMTTDHGTRSVHATTGGETATTAVPALPDGLVDVPDVVGKSQADAMTTLFEGGFLVETLTRSGGPAGVVTAQSPADRRAAPGASITIVVGSG